MAKATFGLDENIAGALSYLFGWISGLIFFLMEKENKFVRFHALQAIIWSFVAIPIALIPLLGLLINLGTWFFLMYKAFKGEKYKLPVIGDFVEKHI